MNDKEKHTDLATFEKEQRKALKVCEILYGTGPHERPTRCIVPGCENPFVYNSGMCTEHAF